MLRSKDSGRGYRNVECMINFAKWDQVRCISIELSLCLMLNTSRKSSVEEHGTADDIQCIKVEL